MKKGLSIFPNLHQFVWMSLVMFVSLQCNSDKKEAPLFEMLDATKTGIQFENKLKPTADFNMFHYMYYYNGA